MGIRLGVALTAFGIASSPLVGRPNVFLALGVAAVGYLLPSMALGRLAKKRQHRIRLSLADVLDLLVVSVEAGLGLDQALQRVGEELATTHPDLSDELRLINLELRAGKARSEALRNLADRTGVDDLSSLAAMLIQTDKFGTSVAQSLRVHSDTLRTKRRQRAEEAAAKTGVKMVFPLVFCIFPAIWVVTIGPAAIKFVQVLFPMAQQ
jgi:tight adherence protein C